MIVKKKVLANLDKCYSIAPLQYQNDLHILVAAEKQAGCLLFDAWGRQVDTVTEGPGGVMTMVQVPATDGWFLATQKFYSPNDSAAAKLVLTTPGSDGWEVQVVAELPFVHRFDILERDGNYYLVACTLKSGHGYQDDWSSPGKVYAAKLPDDPQDLKTAGALKFTVIKDQMTKNHGYFKVNEGNGEQALISAEEGVFLFTPPGSNEDQWEVKTLLETPASDAFLKDLDGDGAAELLVYSPFHGAAVTIYKEQDGSFVPVYQDPQERPFLHAIWGGTIGTKKAAVIGHRQGQQELLLIHYDADQKTYLTEVIDAGRGPANVLYYHHHDTDILIATNRETDEIAMYEIQL